MCISNFGLVVQSVSLTVCSQQAKLVHTWVSCLLYTRADEDVWDHFLDWDMPPVASCVEGPLPVTQCYNCLACLRALRGCAVSPVAWESLEQRWDVSPWGMYQLWEPALSWTKPSSHVIRPANKMNLPPWVDGWTHTSLPCTFYFLHLLYHIISVQYTQGGKNLSGRVLGLSPGPTHTSYT